NSQCRQHQRHIRRHLISQLSGGLCENELQCFKHSEPPVPAFPAERASVFLFHPPPCPSPSNGRSGRASTPRKNGTIARSSLPPAARKARGFRPRMTPREPYKEV